MDMFRHHEHHGDDATDPNEPHQFLAADTYVPIGPFSGGGAAIRGLLTPETVATGREDRCARCGRPADDPAHELPLKGELPGTG